MWRYGRAQTDLWLAPSEAYAVFMYLPQHEWMPGFNEFRQGPRLRLDQVKVLSCHFDPENISLCGPRRAQRRGRPMLQGDDASVWVYHWHNKNDQLAQDPAGFVRLIRGQEFNELEQCLDLSGLHAEIAGEEQQRYAKATVEPLGEVPAARRFEVGVGDCGRGDPRGLQTRSGALIVRALLCY